MARKGKDTETPDFLSRIRTVSTAKETRFVKGKADPVEVKRLQRYGAFRRVVKEFDEGFMEEDAAPIKNEMFAHFIAEGLAIGRCPDNYFGCEGLVSKASLQLKKKTSQSKIKPEHVTRFQALDIRLHYQCNAPNTLRLKPELFADKKMINRMMGTLFEAGFPVDEMFEEQLEDSCWLVHEKTLDDLFAKAKAAREAGSNSFGDDEIRELLEICASVSIGPNWDGDFAAAFQMVADIVKNEPLPQKAKKEKAGNGDAKEKATAKPAEKPSSGPDPVTAAMAASLSEAGFGGAKPAKRSRPRA